MHVLAQGQALSADVTRVEVTVTGAGIDTPITFDLTASGQVWEGTVTSVPAGADRTFAAVAYDAASTALYQGQVTGVSVARDSTALVEIVLQEVDHQLPHDNAAPVIDGVSVSKDQLATGESITVGVTAHDPNAGDTLSYRWSASAGSFAEMASASTTYTAPSTAEVVTLTIEVSDADGATATQSFTLRVGMASVQITASFNDWPYVTATSVETSPVAPGKSTRVTAVVTDANGDPLTYAWTSVDGAGNPCGTFDDAALASPFFTVDAGATAPGGCTLSVAVSDGRGGTGNGSIAFGIGEAGGVTYGANGPVVLSTFQSSASAVPSQQVTLRIRAEEAGTGGPVTFAWAVSAGTLGTPTDTANESTVTWTAPTCLAAGESNRLRVAVTDGASHTITVGFPMSGPGTCMPLVGGVSTASVDAAGAELVSTTTDVTLDIPADSLSATTPVSVALSGLTAPDAVSPVYDFGPAGTVFAQPITVKVPLPDGVSSGSIYWRRHAADGTPAVDADGNPIFDSVGGTVQDGYLVAQISHFSEAYVGPAVTSRTVSGSKVVTYENANLPIDNVPSDFTAQPAPSALVYADGGYTELPGSGAVDGTFIIPDVPNGEYMLHVGNRWVVTSNDAIDLGLYRNGRPDSIPVSSASPAILAMSFTNASPYASSDFFELVSPEASNCWFDFSKMTSDGVTPVEGSTDFSMSLDFAWQYCGASAGLIEGSKGDSVLVGQLVQQVTDAGTPVQIMQHMAVLSPFDLVQGSSVTVDVPLAALPSARTASYTVKMSQFGSELFDANGATLPNVAPTNAEISTDPYPGNVFIDIGAVGGSQEHGMIGNTIDLALIQPGLHPGDVVTGGMEYGVPSTGSWGVFTDVRDMFTEVFALPCPDSTGCQADGHTLRTGRITVGMERQVDIDLQPTGTLVPTLGPVTAAFVNGMSLSSRHTGFGTTPTVSWTPPALGVPDEYDLTLYQLGTYRDGGGLWRTSWSAVATFTTPHTAITLPPNVLQEGQPYLFTITARQTGLANPAQAPFRQATNNATARILSDIQYP